MGVNREGFIEQWNELKIKVSPIFKGSLSGCKGNGGKLVGTLLGIF